MKADVLVGCQWGDEGKAKVVDYLSHKYDIVLRYQGGGNAGHTVYRNGEKFVFHHIPSGLLYDTVKVVLGSGMVIELSSLLSEIELLEKKGIDVKNKLSISKRAFVVLDYHIHLDKVRESHDPRKIGTTLKGIGPAYADKIQRIGIRVGYLKDKSILRREITRGLAEKQTLFKEHYKKDFTTKVEELVEKASEQGALLAPYLEDTVYSLHHALRANQRILLEGAQGAALDIDFGTYPYVTSSSSTSGGACVGSGIPPRSIGDIIGIFKAYVTRVGEGSLPTELAKEEVEELRQKGKEFGATTGRPRNCGWLDLVQAKQALIVNGLSKIVLTKLDVLSGFKTLKVAVAYNLDGEITKQFPILNDDLEKVKPVYKEFEGFSENIKGLTKYDGLPKQAKEYIEFLETELGMPIAYISTGPNRNEMIAR